MRWVRGSVQVLGRYGGNLMRGFARGNFSCYDVGLSNFPMLFMSCIILAGWTLAIGAALLLGMSLVPLLDMALRTFLRGYVSAALIALLVTVTRWSMLHAPWYRKLAAVATFPVFMLSYVPLSVCALFGKAEWQPIRHTAVLSLAQVRQK